MKALERDIMEYMSAIRTGNDHSAMRIIEALIVKGFTAGVMSARNRPLESLDDLLQLYGYTNEAANPPRYHNSEYKGVYFKVVHSRKGTRVLMGVPVAWDEDKNEATRMWQRLGEIRRKNDGRFICYPRYKVELFEDYNAAQIEWLDMPPTNVQYICSNLEHAQDFMQALLPKHVDPKLTKRVTMEDVPVGSTWHQTVEVAPHIRQKMVAGL